MTTSSHEEAREEVALRSLDLFTEAVAHVRHMLGLDAVSAPKTPAETLDILEDLLGIRRPEDLTATAERVTRGLLDLEALYTQPAVASWRGVNIRDYVAEKAVA